MTKFTHKIALCILLGFGFGPLSVLAGNSLTQLDIKKSPSSASTLNVTIYTSSPYDDNVAVSKKGDNKYVIIMPNVFGTENRTPDLTGLHDIISGIDVKSLQDGENGYTKVTLTTTKPVTIRTTTKRSAPLTAEQKAYKNLIALSRTTKPVSKVSEVPKTTIKFDKKSEPVETAPTVPVQQKTKPLIASKPLDIEPDVKPVKTVQNTQNKAKNSVKNYVDISKIPPEPPVIDVNADLEKHAPMKIEEPVENVQTETVSQTEAQPEEIKKDIPDIIGYIKSKTAGIIPPHMLTSFVLLISSIVGLTILIKFIRKSLEHAKLLKQSFKENLLSTPVEVETYDDIVNNTELNWQEKYQRYVDNTKTQEPPHKVLKHIGKGEYKFVNEVKLKDKNKDKIADSNTNANPTNTNKQKNSDEVQIGIAESLTETNGSALLKPKKANKLKSYNKTPRNASPEDIPPIKKVKNQDLKPQKTPKIQIVEDDYKDLEESLERSLKNTPDLEQFNIAEEVIIKQLENNLKESPVFNEPDKIVGRMRKSRKLKSFADKIALEETRRNVPEPKMRSEIIRTKNIEGKHIELSFSPLHSNQRVFEGANLSVGDLIAKSDKFLNKPANNEAPAALPGKNYTTVTLDEFFDKTDSSSSITAPASLASRVADSLGKMSVDMEIKKIQIAQAEAKAKDKLKLNPFDGLVVLSGYSITDDSGFYAVRDKAGKTSLIGRIHNDVTLLKDFGTETNIKLQVRVDSPNVYMVKANGNRYLVEINGNKMGVLLEL